MIYYLTVSKKTVLYINVYNTTVYAMLLNCVQ